MGSPTDQTDNWLLYDGECPFCSACVKLVRIRENVGKLRLVNARDGGAELEEVKAADVAKLKSAKTVQGQLVEIDVANGVKINNAKVVKADIKCGNGVIHVIDTVLLPKE